MKRCTKCNDVYCEEMFHRRRSAKDGRQSICKLCSSVYDKRYRATPRGKAIRKRNGKLYKKTHPQKDVLRWQKSHPETMLAIRKRYRLKLALKKHGLTT